MSKSAKARAATVEVIIAGSGAAQNSALHERLKAEMRALEIASKQKPPRRYVLQVFHTSRLVDGFLAAIVKQHSVPCGGKHSMGAYLTGLSSHSRTTIGQLPASRRARHQADVVDVRNRFLHRAGEFPSQRDADGLLSAMQACIVEIAGLE